MELLKVEGNDLLRRESVSVSCLRQLESDFVILHRDDLMSSKSSLCLKLSLALGIQTEVTGWEENRILEVLLDLRLDGVTNETLLLLVGDRNTTF